MADLKHQLEDPDTPFDAKKQKAGASGDQHILDYINTDTPIEPPVVYGKSWLSAQTAALQSAKTKNETLREAYYPSEPMKFMDSEGELHELVKSLSAISTLEDDTSEVFRYFTSKTAKILLDLLTNHPNIDIKIQVLRIFNDLLEDGEAPAVHTTDLANALMGLAFHTVLGELLIYSQTIADTAEFVILILGILINLVNNFPGSASKNLFETATIQRFVISRLSDEFTASLEINQLVIKQYSTEYLFNISQDNVDDVQVRLLSDNTLLDAILVGLSALTKPSIMRVYADTDEMQELVENLIDMLCLLVQFPVCKTEFIDLQGLELFFRILDVTLGCNGYFNATWGFDTFTKCLSGLFLGQHTDSISLFEKFIQLNGLKHLYGNFDTPYLSLFKGSKKAALKKNYDRILTITIALLKNTSIESVERMRLINKLLEDDYFKVKIMVSNAIKLESRLSKYGVEEEVPTDGLKESYFAKLSDGLAYLQKTYVILAWLSLEDLSISTAINEIFSKATKGKVSDASLKLLPVLQEYRLELLYPESEGNIHFREEKEDYLDMVNTLIDLISP
ncbi:hypothetical protein BABINDRAFT_161481 [Babjeviella inositovora NRRL Y-12698]|uniref:Beta-catenin-like protein 1 N-terminal domain-containing protein n=1 Tax=Babjeviella inositovora NRRL Y-12698 TaxID=984486 RepID=A0A1E3QQ65_9ASCO|nr:uncharacterized protein BABINDRAFT_161481 [Babjeviella inositovora NRRL Y-12698]ODQ79788.1 hypothetical protein BABINDRAFT_161481 [Babjeviella inositovora NRRL Y-12698]